MQKGRILKADQVETRVIHIERVTYLMRVGHFGYNGLPLYKTDIRTKFCWI